MDGFLLETPQEKDVYVQNYRSKPFSVRYASVRSADSRGHSQLNQDYLAFQVKNGSIVFAMCDGVSQSFYGDYASRFLGARLVDWARTAIKPDRNLEYMEKELAEYLQGITQLSSREIDEIPVPEDTPGLLREVLEEKRSLGSETTYVFGRIDAPGTDFPEGRALVSYMGDTRLLVGKRKGRGKIWGVSIIDLETEGKKRWSTRKGTVGGNPTISSLELVKDGKVRISRVIVYTDGLAVLDEQKSRLTDKRINEVIGKAVNSADGDDASFLEIEVV